MSVPKPNDTLPRKTVPKAKPVPFTRKTPPIADVEVSASMPVRLGELEVGESESVSRLVPREQAVQEFLLEQGNKIANTLRAAVARAKKRTGFNYQVNIGRFNTRNDDTCVCVVVTRTE